jgi:hypothetical protein
MGGLKKMISDSSKTFITPTKIVHTQNVCEQSAKERICTLGSKINK